MEAIRYEAGYTTKPSSRRLTTLMELFTAVAAGKREVKGLENLHRVPADANLVVATGHITDFEIPLITATLGQHLNLAITDLSLHRSVISSLLSLDPTILGILLAGQENFLSIKYKKVNGERRGLFKSEDYTRMVAALRRGKSIIMAAHNPSFDGKMPNHSGVGVAHLAERVKKSVILPAVANIEGDKSLGQASNPLKTLLARPSVTISLGEPFTLPKNPMHDRVIRRTNQELVMRAVAKLYPEDKRGIWG